jgi:hypothetical protein
MYPADNRLMPRNVYIETLLSAANGLGSSQLLASKLGIPHEVLRSWMRGEVEPPTHFFLLAVDILNESIKHTTSQKPK